MDAALIGQTISHYRIVERLGGGGMGVVYRAEDTKLRRQVALKFLQPELTRDEDAMSRFELEAQAASALDHPNICTIYEIDQAPDGSLFLAMAYYPGETLKKRITRGPLPVDEALDVAVQAAQGLAKAHAAGIVHRDIKPANVMITIDGLVKIVDFGLAKLVGQTGITRAGTTLGTVAYMSPEQAQGLEVDARTDVWSLGVMLYEMVAGRVPFDGDHLGAIVHQITHGTPRPLTSVRPGIPLDLERIVGRALAKRPEDRYQTAADLRAELQRLAGMSSGASRGRPAAGWGRWSISRWRRWSIPIAVGLGLVVVLAGVLLYRTTRPPPDRTSPPRLTNPISVAASLVSEDFPTWSPDGRLLAFQSDRSGNYDIWVTQIGGAPAINRTSEHSGGDWVPRWSPDGRQIAFYSSREGGGIFVMPALAGGARKIAEAAGLAPPAWSPDGSEIAYGIAENGVRWLERRRLQDGTTTRVALPGRVTNVALDLVWSPNGQFLAYADGEFWDADVTRLWVLRLRDGKGLPLTDGRTSEWSPSWSTDSRALSVVSNRGGTLDLWQQRITLDGAADGAAQRMTTGLELLRATLSPDGAHVAYAKGRRVANIWRVPITDRMATWSDAHQLTFDHAFIQDVDISQDGRTLMVSSDRSGNPDLWMLPATGGDMQQVTTDPSLDCAPAWSPDAREVAFYSHRSGNREIWIQPVNGPARQLTHIQGDCYYPRWSPDAQTILFQQDGSWELRAIPAKGGEPRTMAKSPKSGGDWSPDGRWIVFASPELDDWRVWRLAATGGQPERLTTLKGGLPRWSRDGRHVFFLPAEDGWARTIWSVTADGKDEHRMVDLRGKPGYLVASTLAVDARSLYFVWREPLASDIWVADLASHQP